MQGEPPVLTYDRVLAELRVLREHGLGHVRQLSLPALQVASQQCDLTTSQEIEPAAIEALVRAAVEILGGGTDGEAADYTFGLVQGSKLWPAPVRRKAGAKVYNISVDRFRKAYEPTLIEQTAEGVLALCRDATMRRTNAEMTQRHPADSRLAVQWVERFEAYYRIWTPVYALAADLKAAIKTYREEPADHLPWDPHSAEPYDPADQANGYARCALYDYVRYLLELKRFMTKHGGLWLLSDAGVEQQVVDAVYRIGWHNPLNTDDDSWLRRFLADARHEEPEHFAQMMLATSIGHRIHDEWQEFVAACRCPDLDAGEDGCQVHATIAACHSYCELIDQDWLRIADWYRPGTQPSRGVTGEALYRQHLKSRSEDGK